MNILNQIFGKKRPNSAAIAAEIEKARKAMDSAITSAEGALSGLATMSDTDHVQADAKHREYRRAAERAAARIAELEQAHTSALAAEVEAEQIAQIDRLRERTAAAHHAVMVEGAEKLSDYKRAANAMAAALARIGEIDAEAHSVNEANRHNDNALFVPTIDFAHRKHPDLLASERREKRPCWVFRYPGSPKDTEQVQFVYEAPHEEVREATLKPDGTPYPTQPSLHNFYGRTIPIHPKLENREVVVERTFARRGLYERSLNDVVLPPAFAGDEPIWPRKKTLH
jgi:hypothetical protein